MVKTLVINETQYYHINTVKDYSQSFKQYSQYLDINEMTLGDFLYHLQHVIMNNYGYENIKETYKDNKIIEKNTENYRDVLKYKILIFTYETDYFRLSNMSYIIKKFIREHFFVIYISQDEYLNTDIKSRVFKDLNVKLCFVNVDEKDAPIIFNNNFTTFKTVLTGYAPNNTNIIKIPTKYRNTHIFYRATPLSYIYGDLGQEKVNIGKEMKKHGSENNLNVNIEWEMKKKIFGEEWYYRLVNSKTTLATYSGCEVFDQESRNTEIEEILKENPGYTYEQAKKNFDIEPMFQACRVSPKMFEACALGTVLIMYEGDYKGIFEPNIHYIELKKDLSNINDVIEKIKDDEYLQNMANRAYTDIIKSEKYSYEGFIKYFDSVVKEEYSPCHSENNEQDTNSSTVEASSSATNESELATTQAEESPITDEKTEPVQMEVP